MEFETKEELFAMMHEMLEWIGTIRERIGNTSCRDLTINETLGIANVMNAVTELEDALSELDQTVDV